MIVDICMVSFWSVARIPLHTQVPPLRQHFRQKSFPFLCGQLPCVSHGAGSIPNNSRSHEVASCGNGGELYYVVEWIPAARLLPFVH